MPRSTCGFDCCSTAYVDYAFNYRLSPVYSGLMTNHEEQPFDDLDLDSLDLVELVIAYEEDLENGGDDSGDESGDREPRNRPPTSGAGMVALEIEPLLSG